MVRIATPAARAIVVGLAWLGSLGLTPAAHPAPVTLVARPWGMATLNGGTPFVVPTTVLLEPGEYTLVVERPGYRPAQTTVRVLDSTPQHHMIRLER